MGPLPSNSSALASRSAHTRSRPHRPGHDDRLAATVDGWASCQAVGVAGMPAQAGAAIRHYAPAAARTWAKLAGVTDPASNACCGPCITRAGSSTSPNPSTTRPAAEWSCSRV